MKRITRVQPATLIALLALFVALGGTGYAAFKLPKNSVKSATIKDGQVKTADLGKNAVTGAKVKDGSLTGADVNPGTLGKVPAAAHADSATSATSAANATNATNAANAANAERLGGQLSAAYQGKMSWAVFDADGTIRAQSGGISLVGGFTGTSGAYVQFPSVLSAVSVTGAYTFADGDGRGTPVAELCGGGTGMVTCNIGPNNTTEAFVRTFDANNTTAAPHAFMIVGIP